MWERELEKCEREREFLIVEEREREGGERGDCHCLWREKGEMGVKEKGTRERELVKKRI
jgi:hypothetical protein